MKTFRAFRHRNYALYFLGQIVSLTGTWLQTTVILWLVYENTGQSRWPSWIMVAQVGPTLILGAWGGSLSDRFTRRTLLIVTQILLGLLALTTTLIVGVGWGHPVLLLVLTLFNGIIVAVDFPSRLAFVSELVGREDLGNAVALNALMFNAARLTGPFIAVRVMPWLGPTVCLLLNALSYVAVVAALVAMDPARLQRGPPLEHRPRVSEGLAYLVARPRLFLLLVLTGLMGLFGWPVQVLLPAFAVRHLEGGGQAEYGGLLGAIGLGALLAALVVASFGKPGRREGFLAVGALLASGSLMALAQIRHPWLAYLATCGIGCGLILFFATSQTAMQLGAADHNRGVILGIYSAVLAGLQPLGTLVFGWLADLWNVPGVLMIQGAAMLSSAVAIGVFAYLTAKDPR